jgi:hypothetical protein
MRSSAFERRMLFQRSGERHPPSDTVDTTSIVPHS